MYLSKAKPINLSDDYKIHQKVKSWFEGNQKVLWYQNSHTLYILSERKPNTNIGETKKLNMNEYVKEGDQHVFSIKMNPVYCENTTKKKIKIDKEKTKEWIDRKFKEAGVDAIFKLSYDGYNEYVKDDVRVPVWTVTIRGFLTVVDSVKFKKALKNGIGNFKFIGYGMINIFDC